MMTMKPIMSPAANNCLVYLSIGTAGVPPPGKPGGGGPPP